MHISMSIPRNTHTHCIYCNEPLIAKYFHTSELVCTFFVFWNMYDLFGQTNKLIFCVIKL